MNSKRDIMGDFADRMGVVPSSDIAAAWDNVRRHQERLDCWPECIVEIVEGQFHHRAAWLGKQLPNSNRLKCFVDPKRLRKILDRELHWNSEEIGCWILFDRTGPYLPDVHTLMAFFHLPRTS